MGLIPQDDWGGGMFRGRRAPPNALYDLIGLLDDEGQPFRRGGTVFKSGSAADAALLGLWDGQTTAGQRTFFWSSTSPYTLDTNDSSILDLGTLVPNAWASGVEIGGLVFFLKGSAGGAWTEIIYAGSRKTANYSTGTIALTVGSPTVVGTGTTWTTNVDPGMLLLSGAGGQVIGVVKSVTDNTHLVLTRGSPVATPVAGAYLLTPVMEGTPKDKATAALLPVAQTAFFAVAGQRLIRTRDNRAYFSFPAADTEFLAVPNSASAGVIDDISTDYHELPRAALIIGADSIRDTLLLFTTGGVWTIANMALDPLDDVGNVQHEVSQLTQDVILWGEAGITGRGNAILVPAVDDVYLLGVGGEVKPIAQDILPLYRSYVKAGYQPGIGNVHRGHYFLPVLNGNTVVDDLVCRLDTGEAWSRLNGHAASGAYVQRVGDTTRSPKLLGVNSTRVLDLTGCFDPVAGNKTDADGSNPPFVLTTRDYDLGPAIRKHTAVKVKLEYELIDAASDNPTITGEVAVDAREDGTFTALLGAAPETSTAPYSFKVIRKGERVRFRFTASGPSADLRIKRLEVWTRDAGR